MQVKKVTQKFALPNILNYNKCACITAWKRQESCIAENMSLLALGPVILGEIKGLISYLRSKNLLAKYMDFLCQKKGKETTHNFRVCGAYYHLQQTIYQGDLIEHH